MSELNDTCVLCVMSHQQEHNLVEKVNKLEEVSGQSIDTLISLFVKGYELTEPHKSMGSDYSNYENACFNGEFY